MRWNNKKQNEMEECVLMKGLLKAGIAVITIMIFLLVIGSSTLAAPYLGKIFQFKQPDNTSMDAKVFGDEYYQRVESLDGYTLCRDSSGWICYAVLSADGSDFVSSGVIYRSGEDQSNAITSKKLQKHLKLDKKHILDKVQKKRQILNPAAMAGDGVTTMDTAVTPLAAPITGSVRGLALLINFPDQTSSISKTDIDNMLNLSGYTAYSNNGSVRDYYYNVSGGALTYTNYVAGFYTAKNPKSYYTDPNVQYAQRAMELVKEALQWLDSQGYDFSTLTTDSSKNILAINCYYAGAPDSDWGKGLWPHQDWVNPKYAVDGVYCYKYQMSDIGSSLSIGTTVHENGHMVCGWPDLYDYDGDSSGDGSFCVMSYCDDKNPQVPNPYLRNMAGWMSYTSLNSIAGGSQVTVTAGSLGAYCWTGSNANEYFLVENIRRTGRWATLPAEGLIVWHIDTTGNNNHNQMTASQHFIVSVEQADGRYHLERNTNSGDSKDLYYSGNKTLFDNTTTPNSNWWSGAASGLKISNVGAIGNSITFTVGTGTGSTPTPTPIRTATPTPVQTATPVRTATPTGIATPTPTPGTGGIKIQMYNSNTSATTNMVYAQFKLFNTGTGAITLSNVKIRYYYTIDGVKAQSFFCDYSQAGSSNVTGTFVSMAAPKTNADYYLEIGFTSGAGTLASGANIDIQTRFAKTDWTNYTQTNDYSFNSTATSSVDWTKATGYVSGALQWGTEP